MRRREFVKLSLAGSAAAWTLHPGILFARERAVALVVDAESAVASSGAAAWAMDELERVLRSREVTVRRVSRLIDAARTELCILSTDFSPKSPAIRAALGQIDWSGVRGRSGLSIPPVPETLALVPGRTSGRDVVVAMGSDARGLVYALLELADRVQAQQGAEVELAPPSGLMQQPANPVRSVMRQFTGEPLDRPWFHDREMWQRYLTMLARHRFNRFHLAFGLGYDSLRGVVDSYMLFLYPFVVSVPGFDVRMTGLDGSERERNLEMLQFIGREAVARGLEFQLGIWTHGYELPDSPEARYRVEGLTDETHAEYCRDALTTLLRACPDISALALRIHGESGVAEGSYDFWATVFDGVTRSGRTVEIDLHAKGIDERMIENALATGMPVNLSPKLHAEHMGLPYHQAAIREWEMPAPGKTGEGLMTLSEGQRSFTRYGYADLLRDDRRYTVRHRVFSGTQRLLAWGDPLSAAAYSVAYGFCGSAGMDLMEPLTCRGRRGTGVGTRIGYRGEDMAPTYDWQKYAAWYRTMGRMAYDYETDAEVFARDFAGFGGAAELESGLAAASRILPLVTTAYLPSAACDAYWPEIYWNQPIAEPERPNPYFDTPVPTTFQNASPLDPELFSTMSAFAEELLSGSYSGKYTPLEVAAWLDETADQAMEALDAAGRQGSIPGLRLSVDISITAGLGHFFASKFRAGLLFALFEKTNERTFLERAIEAYQSARAAWSDLSDLGGRIYQDDLSVSDRFSERGQWTDRLSAIDVDIQKMRSRLSAAEIGQAPDRVTAVDLVLDNPGRRPAPCTHRSPGRFEAGAGVALRLQADPGHVLSEVTLRYRNVNQAERFQSAPMSGSDGVFRGQIPAGYTDSPFPLQYYFVLKDNAGNAWQYPGFDDDRMNQPYFVLERE